MHLQSHLRYLRHQEEEELLLRLMPLDQVPRTLTFASTDLVKLSALPLRPTILSAIRSLPD